MTFGDRLRGVVELARPLNVAASGVLTFIGAFVAGGIAGHQRSTVAAILATGLAVAAGNAINDYFDREVDAVNRPGRPLPRGDVRPWEAVAVAVLWFGGAVGLALTLPTAAMAIAAVNLLALIAYTEYFKGLPGVGNAVVAYLGGSTFLFGAAAVGELGPASASLALLAAVATFSREVIKDVEDVAGDAEQGLRTLPIVIGSRRALGLATLALGVAVLASPLPYALGTFGSVYLVAVLPADVVMLYGARRAFEDPGVGQGLLKYGMFLAAAAFVAGRTSVIVGWPS